MVEAQKLRSGQSILVVEDDRKIASLLRTYLEREGYCVHTAHDGLVGLELQRRTRPAFIVLDLMLPGLDGWSFCHQVRRESEVPIMILSAREEQSERIIGLNLGADDYMVKPFSPAELVARVRAIFRRTQSPSTPRNRVSCGALELDPESCSVWCSGAALNLTALEFRLLAALMRQPGRVYSRAELLDAIYANGQVVVDRVIDVHVGKLRQKLEAAEPGSRYVHTVRGFGYSLRVPQTAH